MNRIVLFAFGTSFLLVGLVGLFLAVGYFQDSKFHAETSEWLKAEPEEIWAYITDVNDLPNRRKEVVAIKILETRADGIIQKWEETPDMGGYMIFELRESIPNKLWKIELTDASFKMRGSWTYSLERKIPGTVVTITEDSEITSVPVRGAYFLAGRDATLQKEMELIRNRFSGR
ncbi:SRPBCC family protein [Leptospira sp. 2 VSF19]|uniref:SRPBCC family protein n=1 Tax=Leptospira soteropolitanensis TaxID=2950025 RepID=A0AAW5VFV0_9LEPT|nr:SRPBCC family protein [Leptospira soteropolitanensis]MCW7491381.1 SRPBCC family protein [Leptospira soteropolitanensis]MCW7498966.1 SRPBCC family protein [Leptospira soteropolitanensis]MCW7521442.1 SRPBCC family protein [Leptospira soteropolitanensis]MCW7525069.1 SRPBCC family protein [Leptospira soteropolitanensis]MCW7528937.1 SRPBCC family protein [Leptospira soteropolitanensis]